MSGSSDASDLRGRLDNALAVLGATPSNDVRAVRQTFALLKDTLDAVRGGLDELEAQLEVVTAPEREAAVEIVAMEKELGAAAIKIASLEQKLAMASAGQEAETQLRAAEQKRLKELEKKVAQFEELVATDSDAFASYFEKALDEDEKKRGRKPPRR